MNIRTEIDWVKNELEHVQDVNLVVAIRSMLSERIHARREAGMKPITTQEYIARIQESEKDIAAGKTSSHDDVVRESANW